MSELKSILKGFTPLPACLLGIRKDGHTLLTFDIDEDGVHLEYDPADLQLIIECANEYRGYRP